MRGSIRPSWRGPGGISVKVTAHGISKLKLLEEKRAAPLVRLLMRNGLTRETIGRGGTVASKKATVKEESIVKIVDFSFGAQTYQIDPDRQKVYRRFVEIETGRASTIFASWRASNV